MADMSFDDAVKVFMYKIFSGQKDDDYDTSVDTITYLWDQDRANQINKAVLPSVMYKNSKDGELYIIIKLRPLTYLQVKRNRHVRFIEYGL